MSTPDREVNAARRLGRLRNPGLYAITDEALCAEPAFEAGVRAALRGGAVVVQYRDKSTDTGRRARQARTVVKLCAEFGALSIINDDVSLALDTGADGVHLGRDDAAIAHAREALGPAALIGVSCYDRFDAALQSQAEGADYIAFGSFYPSSTKPHAVRAAPDLLARANRELSLPATAIGGISADNGRVLIDAGAHYLAVITALFGAQDVEGAARRVAALFDA